MGQTCLRSQKQLVSFPLLSFASKLPVIKQATLCDDKCTSCYTGQQKPNHIQRVVLEPGEVVPTGQVLVRHSGLREGCLPGGQRVATESESATGLPLCTHTHTHTYVYFTSPYVQYFSRAIISISLLCSIQFIHFHLQSVELFIFSHNW